MSDGGEVIRLDRVTKRFDRVLAVDAVSLAVQRGEFVCLLGPSGCGKTTILRIIAGFVEPDAGVVFIGGRDVSAWPPNRRDIGMVYQSYALFPHMTVFGNVAFGLRMRRVPTAVIGERVSRALEMVRLSGLEGRKPGQLSGGQQQRVALARAIVIQPTVLLLDEPLSSLDAKLRKQMQLELKMLQGQLGITTLHVTHDQEEALVLADTVVILNQGMIEQTGRPRTVYAEPRSRFVADFLGQSNFLKGEVVGSGAGSSNDTVVFRADRKEVLAIRDSRRIASGTTADAFIRPERVRLRRSVTHTAENLMEGTVQRVIFTGPLMSIEVKTATGRQLTVDGPSGQANEEYQPGEKVTVELPPEDLRIILAN